MQYISTCGILSGNHGYILCQLKLDIARQTSGSQPETAMRHSGAPIVSFVVVQVNTETRGWARSRNDNASLQFTDLHDLRKR